MANDLRLQVVLDLVNAASGPLRNITKGSEEAAKALKATRDTLQKLNAQQKDIASFRDVKRGLQTTSAELKAAQERVGQLARQLSGVEQPTKAMTKELESAKKQAAKLGTQFQEQQQKAQKLRDSLHAVGIKTKNLDDHDRQLRQEVQATTKAFDDQTAKIKALNEQRGKLFALNRQHSKEMISVGMLAGTGLGMQSAGRSMARPVLSSVQAYTQQESASSQLKGAMMLADGSVSAEFGQINELAMSLGDRLPGTTADFIEMMRTLKEQGISAKSILGGTGEAAAYLAVQLKMPAAEAAEFAAQLQDATRTGEKDMMALMDLIQRTKYTGVDSGYMLQGFSKMSPILSTIKQEGVQAANTLAPLLSMMNQSGMTDGGSAGNAIRKVFDSTLDAKKLQGANDTLKLAGAGFQLNFTDKNGNFAGLDNLYAQLEKIKGIQSDVTRREVLKDMFGDDAETLQVLNVMMDKGKAGYEETVAKLQAQADLRQRVNAELGTIANLWDSATGSFTNVMAAMGETVAPEVKSITTWLGEVAASTRAWIAEHPTLVGWIVKIVAVIAGLVFLMGTLTVTLASILGPFFILRFLLARTALGFFGMRDAATTTAPTVSRLSTIFSKLGAVAGKLPGWFSAMGKNFGTAAIKAWGHAVHWGGLALTKLGTIIRKVPGWFSAVGKGIATAARFLMANPMVLIITAIILAIAGLAYLLYKYWKPVCAFFNDIWQSMGGTVQGALLTIGKLLINWSPLGLLYKAIATALSALGIDLPKDFTSFGSMLIDGLINGITNKLRDLKDAVGSAANVAVTWFKEKTGIRSPSRVFIQSGQFLGEGAAIGIRRSTDMVRKASVGMAAAATIGMAGAGEGPRIDQRPPLQAGQRAPSVIQGDTITIQITAAPGTDPQALARAISAELDRRDRAKAARRRSALGDVN